jgi:Flp pilus assembly protein TadB
MDMNKWNEYEAKLKKMHQKYNRIKIIWVLIWLICAAIVTAVWILFKDKLGSQLLFMGILFSNAILIFIFFRKIREQKIYEKQQEALLQEEEPIGKFKT